MAIETFNNGESNAVIRAKINKLLAVFATFPETDNIQTRINAIESLLGDAAGDGNNLVDKIREVLPLVDQLLETDDLKDLVIAKVSIADVVNDLLQTVSGKVLDARQGKVLDDKITLINSQLSIQEQVGVMVNDTFARGSLGAAWTKTGTNASFVTDGAKLLVSGGVGSITEYIVRNDYVTNGEDFTVEMDYKVVSYGFSIGVLLKGSSSGQQRNDALFLFDASNSASNQGKITLWSPQTISPKNVPFTLNSTIMKVVITASRNNYTCTVTNPDTGITNTIFYKYPLLWGSNTTQQPQQIRFGIATGGGSFEVTRFKVTNNSPKRPFLMGVGDSLLAGYYGGSTDDRIFNLLAAVDRSRKVVVYAKPGIISADVVECLPEIIAQNPQNVMLQIGYNDVYQSVPQATTIANITTIKNQLEAAGINFILLSVPMRETLNSAIRAAFPATRFVNYNHLITDSTGNTYVSGFVYNSTDNVHLNKYGNFVAFTVIYNQCRDLFPTSLPVMVNDGKLSNTGDRYSNDLVLGTQDNFGQYFITNNLNRGFLSKDGQWKLGTGNSPHASSVVDIESSSKGFLLPRLTTTQRDAIASPAEGLKIYNLTTHTENFWNGTVWKSVLTD